MTIFTSLAQLYMQCKNVTFICDIHQRLIHEIMKMHIQSLTTRLHESHVKSFRVMRDIKIDTFHLM